MITPLPIQTVFDKLCEQKLQIEHLFPEHRPKKVVDLYDHLCSMEHHLRMSHRLHAETVHLNQAEVATLVVDFSTFKN